MRKEEIKGAYDKEGVWWYEEEIKDFSGGMVRLFFGKEKEEIQIVNRTH